MSASSWGPSKKLFFSLFCVKLFSNPSHLCSTWMVSFSKRYQHHQIGKPPPSGQSRHHWLTLVLPYPTSPFWGFSIFFMSHPDSFRSVILWAGSLFPNLLSHFRFSRLGVKPRLCRSFWRALVSTHPLPFIYPREALLYWFSLTILESAFLQCGVHPYFSMLSLWSFSLSPRCSSRSSWLSPTSRFGALDRRLSSFSCW